MALTYNTLNALTEKYFASKRMADIVFHATPTLAKLQQNTVTTAAGTQIEFPIEYGEVNGNWRALGGSMTLTTPEIATRGYLPFRWAYVAVQLYEEHVDLNRNNPQAIASYLDTYMRNAAKKMSKILSTALWTPQSGNSLNGIIDAVGDSATYAGIALTDVPRWRSVVAEAKYGSPSVPVSPSLENFQKMVMTIQAVCDEKPQMIVTSLDVWSRLAKQVSANDVVAALRSGEDTIRWGFSTIFINGVPCVADLDLQTNACSDFDPSQSTRAQCGGHRAYFLNFDYLKLYTVPGWNCQWRPEGWFRVADTTTLSNTLMFGGNVVCTNRRAQGVIYGIDPTLDEADFTEMEINLTNLV